MSAIADTWNLKSDLLLNLVLERLKDIYITIDDIK
jgi:hypothetical protein